MRELKKAIMSLLLICVLLGINGIPTKAAEESDNVVPTAQDNLSVGLRSSSELVATSNGYMRVFYNGTKIGIEYYDNSFNILSKKYINIELSLWGGFYAGSDAYYIVEGQYNTDENDTAEVIRVIKYDTNWNKKGTAQITSNPDLFGGEVRYPFDYGCVEMTEYNGTLYVVTGHEGYVDASVGQGHQGFLMIAVNEASMTGSIVDCDLWHSFAQYIENDGSDLYVLEQSEGSRYTKLSKYNADSLSQTSISVLEYGGSRTSAWAIACYASVDDMALSSNNVLCLGTSIDQSKYDDATYDTPYNIYLTVTPKSDFSDDGTTVKWLTNYTDDGKSFCGTKITKVNDNRFLITWQEYDESQTATKNDGLSSNILHYIFVDGNGDKISSEFTAAAPISDCHPIVKGSKIVYYASNGNMVDFYSINTETGAFSKKVYRVAGDNATWNIKKGVLTISGTGAITIDNIAESVNDSVKKIVISEGITSIPDYAFQGLSSLEEVTIESGLKSIGKEAFYCCGRLTKITIPASVKTIGEDILWTGYRWIGSNEHVTNATIYAPYGSYAIKYAKKNKISYSITDYPVSKAKISGLKTSYSYTGKAVKPSITLKLSGKTLKKGTDYTVSYKNNKQIGKATITIKGKGIYSGKVTKTFKIVPKKETISKLTSSKSRTIKVKWKKDTKATGYQIQYAQNSKFTSGKQIITIKKKTTVSKTITKLVKNKEYYVRVRSYKKINGKTYYGKWSKSESVICK
jgi:hypothetical protein